jgi:hypothetical protein
MKIGDTVRTLPPFDGAFPDTYIIRDIQGTTAFLDGIPEGFADAFDFDHLVLA